MSTRDLRAWMAAARREERLLEEQLSELRRRHAQTEQASGDVAAEVERATQTIGELLLPELTAETLARAVALTGCTSLQRTDPLAALEAEQAELQRELAALEVDPRVVEFDARYGPEGTTSARLAELEAELRPLSRLVERAAHERLDHLIDVGYGTEEYDVPWWRMSYYADWKAGDEVLEQLDERYPTFGEFLEEYMRVSNARQGLINERNDLKREVDDAEEARGRKTTVGVRLGTLPESHAQRVRLVLFEHLAQADWADLKDGLASAPVLAGAIKRWQGLEAKHVYLNRLKQVRLEEREQELSRQLGKIRRKLTKFRRPKYRHRRFPADDWMFRDRSAKYAKYWRKYDRDYELIYEFDDYDYWDYEDDFLWWDAMVDGRNDGMWIEEVRVWRSHHPDYVYERPEHFDDGEAAAAVAAADFDDADDYAFDAS